MALDLERRPRMNRSGTERIEVHGRKQACENEMMLVLHIAKLWGWKDESLHPRRRMKIARAACTQVAYDFGYAKPLSAVRLRFWESILNNAIADGTSQEPLSPQNGGSIKYCDKIEST